MASRRERYLGLMSGTSADGIDAVVAAFDDGRFSGLQGRYHLDYPAGLRERLLALGLSEAIALPLSEYAHLDAAVGQCFADAALGALGQAGLAPDDVAAIGSHGQTIFHDPRGVGNSLQIGDPNCIAARTGITVVADFRRADIALGGQGAPLVPAFHHAVFAADEPRAVLNIGGIANITLLPGRDPTAVRGFDTGPGNGLLDEWAHRSLGRAYDEDGRLAAAGTVREEWVAAWLADPYFNRPPPKSTGRAQFNLGWAINSIGPSLLKAQAADVAASLCELTARSAAATVPKDCRRLLLCGGGIHNLTLIDRLKARLPGVVVESTANAGLPPEWVEATAFAWLARQRMLGLPGNLPAVTGASAATLLGAVYSVMPGY